MIKKTSLLAPFVLFGSTAQAAMILVNFGVSTDATGLGYNPIAGFTSTPTGLTYSDGTSSGYQLTYTKVSGAGNGTSPSTPSDAIQTSWNNLTGHDLPSAAYSKTLNFDKSGATCTITGLTAGMEYTFFAMEGRGSIGSAPMKITFTGIESYSNFTHIKGSGTLTPSLTLNNGTLTTGNISQGSGTANYTELTFIADASGTFSFNYTGTDYGYSISAFGLKEGSIPEPATATLGMLALAAFGFRRRKA